MNNMPPYNVVISSKGQVIIPSELRARLGLGKGTAAIWTEEKGRLVLTPFERMLDEIQGSLKPLPGEPSMFEELCKERARERKREKE